MTEQSIDVGLVRLLFENLTKSQKDELKGVGLNFIVEDNRIGIKYETDSKYTYIDLDDYVTTEELNEALKSFKVKQLFKIIDELPVNPEENIIYLKLKENSYNNVINHETVNIIKIVTELPKTGDNKHLYFVKNDNTYNVYAYVNDIWIKINTETQLSEYSTTKEVNKIIDEKLSERDYKVVNELPDTGNENTLYFVKLE